MSKKSVTTSLKSRVRKKDLKKVEKGLLVKKKGWYICTLVKTEGHKARSKSRRSLKAEIGLKK